ncbi:MAG: hypothetical protein OH338_04935 [Candidatus Parvarchaeota archaeon]|nr:hypothetical protein [Candidatus Parvarchaeum tengchongense]
MRSKKAIIRMLKKCYGDKDFNIGKVRIDVPIRRIVAREVLKWVLEEEK